MKLILEINNFYIYKGRFEDMIEKIFKIVIVDKVIRYKFNKKSIRFI